MDNIKYSVKDKKLRIEIDLEHEGPFPTKSGNVMVATSDNWARLNGMPGWNFNMVLTKKPGSMIPDTAEAVEKIHA